MKTFSEFVQSEPTKRNDDVNARMKKVYDSIYKKHKKIFDKLVHA
jgi:hypothetical protein